MKNRLKAVWRWLRKEVLNKQMLLWLIIAEALFWSPVIVGGVLGFLFNSWFYTICAAYIGFWGLPLTPAIPIQLGLAYGLKKIHDKIKRKIKKEKDNENNEDNNHV